MSPEKQKYGTPKQEMLAVVTFLEKWHAYLADKEFNLRVDNVAFRWLQTGSLPTLHYLSGDMTLLPYAMGL